MARSTNKRRVGVHIGVWICAGVVWWLSFSSIGYRFNSGFRIGFHRGAVEWSSSRSVPPYDLRASPGNCPECGNRAEMKEDASVV